MRSHPKKRQVVQPDAAPRGDSSYAISSSHSLRILCRGRATLRHNNSERAGFYAVTRF